MSEVLIYRLVACNIIMQYTNPSIIYKNPHKFRKPQQQSKLFSIIFHYFPLSPDADVFLPSYLIVLLSSIYSLVDLLEIIYNLYL